MWKTDTDDKITDERFMNKKRVDKGYDFWKLLASQVDCKRKPSFIDLRISQIQD